MLILLYLVGFLVCYVYIIRCIDSTDYSALTIAALVLSFIWPCLLILKALKELTIAIKEGD